jgi:hypothetical protein
VRINTGRNLCGLFKLQSSEMHLVDKSATVLFGVKQQVSLSNAAV